MKSSPLPSHLRSTIAERQSALERAVENAVFAAEQLDKARAVIGQPPAERSFFLATEIDALLDARTKARAKPLSHYEMDKAEREKAKAERERAAAPIAWTPEAIFKMLDYNFANSAPSNLADGLHVVRLLVLGDDAERGALEQFAATAGAALERLKQVDRVLEQHAEREAAAEEAIARHEILPLRKRASEPEVKPL